MKKYLSSMVLIVVLLTIFAFADYIYIVTAYSVDKAEIKKGDNFELTLDLERIANLDDTTKLTLINNSEAFSLSSGGSAIKIGSAGAKIRPTLKLNYRGGENSFVFSIISDSDGKVIASDKVLIKEALKFEKETEDDTPSAPVDSTKFQPKFDLMAGAFSQNLASGRSYYLNPVLKNISKYNAKNIRAELVAGEDPLPFAYASSRLKTNLKGILKDKKGKLEFKLNVDPMAESKTYRIKLKLEFENGHGDSFTQELPVNVLITNNERKPIVSLANQTVVGGELDPEQTTDLELDFVLDGTLEAKNIEVSLTGFSSEGISLASGSANQHFPVLAPNVHAKLTYKITAMPAAVGVQNLVAKITYFDQAGNKYEREEPIFVRIKGVAKANPSGLAIKFGAANYYMTAGSEAVVTATVTNVSDKTMENLKVELATEGSLTRLSAYINYIEKLTPGASKSFSYRVGTAKEAGKGNYPIEVSVVPTGSAEAEVQKQIDVTAITISDVQANSDKSKPKIIISSYDYGGESVMAGKVFPLTVTFTNTSQTMGIQNVKASFSSTDNLFLPVDTANSFYVESIGAGDSVTKTVNLTTKNDTEPKIYSLNFTMSYEDANGKAYDNNDQPYKDEEQITINVKQENRLEVGDLNLPETVMLGQEIALDANFFNMGKSTMYNLLVTLEGDFDKRDSTRFVGTFAPGANEYFSASIIPNQEGEQKGLLKFSFEDNNGEPFTVEKEIILNVEAGGMPEGGFDGMPGEGIDKEGDFDPMGEDGMPPADGSNAWQSLPSYLRYGIIIVAAIVATVAVVVYRRKKRAKDLLESIEDED